MKVTSSDKKQNLNDENVDASALSSALTATVAAGHGDAVHDTGAMALILLLS